jgi:hypothetical protein
VPVTTQFVVLVALAIIAIIGLDMLVRQPKTRSERDGAGEPLPDGMDPTALRRRTPRAQRLSGAVLISAAAFVFGAVYPHM